MAEEARFELRGAKLPKGAWAVAYECAEGVSRPYRLTVEFSTTETDFDVDACLRSQVTLVVKQGLEVRRIIDAVVQEVSFRRVQGDTLYFEVRAGSVLDALAHRRGSRIFQDQSIVDVVSTVFQEGGFLERVQKQLDRILGVVPAGCRAHRADALTQYPGSGPNGSQGAIGSASLQCEGR